MQYIPDLDYPPNEKSRWARLENLFSDWQDHFATNRALLLKHKADDMVFDGFYPYYFSQKKKILFIGRESRKLSGDNYLETLSNAYQDKRIGKQHINANKFHSRMLHIAYGILNGMCEWKDIKWASEIGETFGKATGVSFAFMNISKLSNDGPNWTLDNSVYKTAFELSTNRPDGRNFIQEEIALLKPNIVIAMNLDVKALGETEPVEVFRSKDADVYTLTSGNHRSLLINTWHFSATRKDDVKHYYDPICEAIRVAKNRC